MIVLSERARNLLWHGLAVFIVAAGVWLRWQATHSELTQDEITSLAAVGTLTRWHQVFWKIDGDNNHYLNSLWLYIVGPGVPAPFMRLPAILFGGLTIVEAGSWLRRDGRFASLAAMALFACSYMMVDYGAIARGYSGLILFSLLSFRLIEDMPRAGSLALRRRTALGLVILLGFLSHLYMALAVAGLEIYCAWELHNAGQSFEAAASRIFRIFGLPALMLLPLAASLAYALYDHSFTLGESIRFDLGKVLGSYSLALEATADIPVYVHYLFSVFLGCALALLFHNRVGNARSRLYLSLIVILPLALLCIRMRNLSLPRYFMPCAVAYLLMIADGLGRLWRWKRKRGQAIALALLAMLLFREMASVDKLLEFGRGHYAEAVARIGAEPGQSFGVTHRPLGKVALYYAGRQHLDIRLIPEAEWCRSPPGWLLQDSLSLSHKRPDEDFTWGPEACPVRFRLVEIYPFWGLTGFQWNLYRRADTKP